MLKRSLAKKAHALSTKFPVVGILGPRQSGKTTLAQETFKKHNYVSLEDLDTREFALNEPREFLEAVLNDHGVIIDEAQQVPQLFSYIQTFVDTSQKPGEFILTGSQNFHLNAHISQSLAGRIAIVTLLPLSIEELEAEKRLPTRYETLLLEGGYPRIHAQKIDPRDWYPNYIQTYVERDIRQLKNVSDLSQFQKFVKLCAGRVGQLLNFSDLGRDCGISHNTAKAWIALLEASYILFQLRPYYKNFSKRLVKSSKLYFYDTGLACSLLGIHSTKQLETHYLKGNLFESFMISEYLKGNFNRGILPELYFWRDKTGHEIDCITETSEGLRAVEIKAGKGIPLDYFDQLRYFQKLAGLSPKTCFVIYGGNEDQKRKYGNVISWRHVGALK